MVISFNYQANRWIIERCDTCEEFEDDVVAGEVLMEYFNLLEKKEGALICSELIRKAKEITLAKNI